MSQAPKYASESFNKFVEGDDPSHANNKAKPEKAEFWDSFGAPPKGPPKEKKDFWDEFAGNAETRAGSVPAAASSKPKSSIGTMAVKPTGPSSAAGKKDDEWGDW